MPSPALPVVVPVGSTIVWVGDSFIGPGATAVHNELTAGLGAAFGWLIANLAAKQYARQNPLVNTRARSPVVIPQISVIDNGISGTGVQTNPDHTGLADLARYVTVIANLPATGPCFLFWLVSQNDRGAYNNFATAWQTPAETFANAVVAARPNVTVVLLGMLFGNGEVVSRAGPAAWGLNNFDGQTDSLNAQVQAWAASRGYYWIDVRGTNITDPDTIALWEWTNNPGQVAFGPAFLTQDGGHPNFVTGQGVVAGFVIKRLSLPFS